MAEGTSATRRLLQQVTVALSAVPAREAAELGQLQTNQCHLLGPINEVDGGVRGLAKQANAVVVSIDYRLAPEARFPAQHDDVLAAYRWALANAASIRGDPRRVALAGESARGNLAAATAVAARDARPQKPVAVIPVHPVARPDTTAASSTTYATVKPPNRAMMGRFARHTTRTGQHESRGRITVWGSLGSQSPAAELPAGVATCRQLLRACATGAARSARPSSGDAPEPVLGLDAIPRDAGPDPTHHAGIATPAREWPATAGQDVRRPAMARA